MRPRKALIPPPASDDALLTPRWTPLDYHAGQVAYFNSLARFKVNHSGRRGGKTELFKREGVLLGMEFTDYPDGRFIFGAPTYTQAYDIYWEDLKLLVPEWFIMDISESRLIIKLINGVRLFVMGMDKPERVEGSPLDFIALDEFGNMKPTVWTQHVRPALDTKGRPGIARLGGVPEGYNHYADLIENAKRAGKTEWEVFGWHSSTVLSESVIAKAKEELDELSYNQEYGGQFVRFEGRAYYGYADELHITDATYDPRVPLDICFDFNVAPGCALICQEQEYHGDREDVGGRVTLVLGEIWVPHHSNTPIICRKLLENWGHHPDEVRLYGDATGGLPGTAKIHGTDWDLIRAYLKPIFQDRLTLRVPKSNPSERARVNAVNSRLLSSNGTVRVLIDRKCKNFIRDMNRVMTVKGGSGELDKKSDQMLTHISDAFGYYIQYEHATSGNRVSTGKILHPSPEEVAMVGEYSTL